MPVSCMRLIQSHKILLLSIFSAVSEMPANRFHFCALLLLPIFLAASETTASLFHSHKLPILLHLLNSLDSICGPTPMSQSLAAPPSLRQLWKCLRTASAST